MSKKIEEKKETKESKEIKEEPKTCPLPEILTFKGVRKRVLKNVWAKADKMVLDGVPLTDKSFSDLLKAEWKRVKAKTIPASLKKYETCLQHASLEHIAEEIEAKEKDGITALLPDVDIKKK